MIIKAIVGVFRFTVTDVIAPLGHAFTDVSRWATATDARFGACLGIVISINVLALCAVALDSMKGHR